MENSFYFILNPLNFEDKNPFELIPGYFLKKPDASQLALIAGKLNGFSMLSHWPPFHHMGYNCDWVPNYNPDGNRAGNKLEMLPQGLWRYWIIGFDTNPPHKIGDDSDIGKLQCSTVQSCIIFSITSIFCGMYIRVYTFVQRSGILAP